MRKELIGFIAGCAFTATALIGGPALADAYSQSINVQVDSVKVTSAGKDGTEPTILWNNKTYIPMRETLENANCRVTYYDATKSVVVNNRYEKCGDLLSCNGNTLSRDDAIYYWDKDGNMTFYIDANYLIGYCGVNINTVGETYGKTTLPKQSTGQNIYTNTSQQNNISNQQIQVPTNNQNQNTNTTEQVSLVGQLNTLSEYFIYSDDGENKYLGKITKNPYDSESIWNNYSSYGSIYNTHSIWNDMGKYGNTVGLYSSSATLASHPPKIYDKNGNFVAYLTENAAKYPSYTKIQLSILFEQK